MERERELEDEREGENVNVTGPPYVNTGGWLFIVTLVQYHCGFIE